MRTVLALVALLYTLYSVSIPCPAVAETLSYTTFDDPLGVGGTVGLGISGNDIVGYYIPAGGGFQGFLYNGSTYTTIADPLGVNGTQAIGISGNNIVGLYVDASYNVHGF